MKKEDQITVVSAFMANINQRKDRSYDKYILLSSHLLKTNIKKIIFIDEDVIDEFTQFNNENTMILPFIKETNYLYKYKNTLKLDISTTNPTKDTIEYIFTMCYKTEFIRNAIEINPFGSSQFIWIDLGIKHMIPANDNEFIQKIEQLKYKEYNKLRIASIWNPDNQYWLDIYKDISWVFAGSIFGGSIEVLEKFADLTKNACLKIIEERNSLMWEINVWWLIYKDNRDIFDYYTGWHDNSILDNY